MGSRHLSHPPTKRSLLSARGLSSVFSYSDDSSEPDECATAPLHHFLARISLILVPFVYSSTTSAPTDVKASKDNKAKVEGKYMSKYNFIWSVVITNERFNVSKEKTTEQKLYVSGISEETKASDLQDLFTKHAKIIDAKIIRFSKIPNKCFGLVTFENDSQLEKCVQALNKASLKGCAIALSQVSSLLLVISL